MSDYQDVFETSEWPLAKFYFKVTIDDTEVSFQGVDGLESELSIIEYRDGDSPFLFKSKRYGMATFSNITLKKGMFAQDAELQKWWHLFSWEHTDRTDRRTVVIELMDESAPEANVRIRWDIYGCFPVKFSPTALDAEADSEVAIEELELACESWSVTFG